MSTVINQEKPADVRNQSTELVRYITPDVNIYENADDYVLEAELPGVNREGLDITVDANELTIVGHRATAEVPGDALYRESVVADYRRAFELDPAIDTAKISAHIEQGVVTVQLPKSERVKPRKITVSD